MKKSLVVAGLVSSLLVASTSAIGLPSLVFILLQGLQNQQNAAIIAFLIAAVLAAANLAPVQALGVAL